MDEQGHREAQRNFSLDNIDPRVLVANGYITQIRALQKMDDSLKLLLPPDSSLPQNKKYQVIIVAVKKFGRVRIHKG